MDPFYVDKSLSNAIMDTELYRDSEGNSNETAFATADSSNLPTIELPPIPRNEKEALAADNPHRADWLQAILSELAQLDERQSLQILSVAESKDILKQRNNKVMTAKIAFRVSLNLDSSLKFKTRLVARGFTQQRGVDYKETFSPTCTSLLLNIVQTMTVAYGWDYCTGDIANAYLEASHGMEHSYMELPRSITGAERILCRLIGALYGTKQAGHQFNSHLHKILIECGFRRMAADPCGYVYIEPEFMIILIVYVDDLWLTCSFKNKDADIKKRIESFFKKINWSTERPTRFVGVTQEDRVINQITRVSVVHQRERVPQDHRERLRTHRQGHQNLPIQDWSVREQTAPTAHTSH